MMVRTISEKNGGCFGDEPHGWQWGTMGFAVFNHGVYEREWWGVLC